MLIDQDIVCQTATATRLAQETLDGDKKAGMSRLDQLEAALGYATSMLSVFMPANDQLTNSTYRYMLMLQAERPE